MSHDAVVIGAGVNGLVAAHLLARAGRRVLVLERSQDAAGGPDIGWVPPRVARSLDLGRHGLEVEPADPWLEVPLEAGGSLVLSADERSTADAIRKLSPGDAARWPEFCHRMHRVAEVLAWLYRRPAPDVSARSPGELLGLGLTALRTRRLGRQAVIDLLRVLPMPAATLLDEWFECEPLRGALAAVALWHLSAGPRSGGTAFTFLHHHVGSPPGVFRPPRSNVGRVLAGLPGVELRRGAEARRIAVRGGRVRGVVLASGDEIETPVVLSGADPRATLLGMLEPGWLDPELARAVANVRCRGVAARVRLSLDGPPPRATLAVAPSLDHLERAYDAAKYGRVSGEPYLEASAADGGLDVHVQYAPYALEGGWNDERRRALGDAVVERLAAAVPSLRGRAGVREILTPADLEQRHGLTQGNAYHGEMALDQSLFMRPVGGWSRYRTPIGGLWLCGPGTHPGGGIQGAAGYLAAKAVLQAL